MLRLVSICGLICASTAQISAYTYTFRNLTNKSLAVAMQLVGVDEPYHLVLVPSMQNGMYGENALSFGGGRIGFCLNANTTKAWFFGEQIDAVPMTTIFTSHGVFNQLIAEVVTHGRTVTPLGNTPYTAPGICGDQIIYILLDPHGVPRLLWIR